MTISFILQNLKDMQFKDSGKLFHWGFVKECYLDTEYITLSTNQKGMTIIRQ